MPRASKQEYASPSRPHRSGSRQLAENLSRDELLKRLKKIAQEIYDAEQGKNLERYNELAESLGKNFIVKHADKDVRLYAASCISIILRIFAPDQPFESNQLWSIFDLIISQLEGLGNPKGSSFEKSFGLLEILSEVKSLIICAERGYSDLVLKLFTTLFSCIREEHSVKVQHFMSDIMSSVLVELESIPQQLLDTILENVVNPKKTSNPSAYKLASALIKKADGTIEPYVQMFFNNALFFEKNCESQLVQHLYDLIYELYRISPSVLLSVLPQLELKLKNEKETERLDVTKMLGKMFSDEESDLAQSNRPLWQCYLGRFVDVSVSVRVECTRHAKYFLLNHPELVDEISGKLCERQRDPDERVRIEVVTTICDAASDKIESIPEKLFDVVAERLRDRKIHIRKDTMMCLGRLYKKISGSDANNATMKKISWIPIKIMHCYYQNSIEDRLWVEKAFLSCLVPLTLGSKERMRRLLELYVELDEPGTKAFKCMFKLQASLRSDMNDALRFWEEHQKTNSEEAKKLLTSKISMVAGALPDPGKAQENLKRLVKMFSDKKFFALMKICVGSGQECAKVSKAVSEVAIKIGAKNPIFEAVKALLDRAAPLLIDSSAGEHLVKMVSKCVKDGDIDSEEDTEEDNDMIAAKALKAMDLLLCCASVFPTEFRFPSIYELILVNLKNDSLGDIPLEILTHIGQGLDKFNPNLASHFQQTLSKILTKGTPSQVKLAARSVSRIYSNSSVIFQRILENERKSLDYESSKLVITLSCIGQIARLAPSVFEQHYTTVIRDFVVKDLLMKDRGKPAKAGPMWCDASELSKEIKAKIQAIKLLVNWLRGLQTNDKTKILPVIRILDNILRKNGDITSRGHVRACEMSYMKLTAACGLLKLASESVYHEFIEMEYFQTLSSIMQDPCSNVRTIFAKKLCKGLESLKLPLEYLTLFALSAKDSSSDRRQQAKQMLGRCIHVRNEYLKHHSSAPAHSAAILPEYALPYLIHLLSHLPNVEYTDVQSLKDIKTYLWFFLEAVLAKGDNYSFLKKLAENVKLTKDATAPDDKDVNNAIYTVCDIAIGLILSFSKTHTFLLKDFTGNLVLPKKLFVPLNKGEVNSKSYLPKDFVITPSKKMSSNASKTTPTKPDITSSTSKKSTSEKKPRERVSRASKGKKTQKSLMDILQKKTKESDEDSSEEEQEAETRKKKKASPQKPAVPMKEEKPTRFSPRKKASTVESSSGEGSRTRNRRRNESARTKVTNEDSPDELSKAPFDKRIEDSPGEVDVLNGLSHSSADHDQSEAIVSSEKPSPSKKRKATGQTSAPELLQHSSLIVKRKRTKR